jgi:AbrB family looped-hinge helix DNA binding protein
MAKKPDLVTRYEVITQEDPSTGDLILPIPPPVLDRLNWKEGDTLDISIDKDGKIYLKKN